MTSSTLAAPRRVSSPYPLSVLGAALPSRAPLVAHPSTHPTTLTARAATRAIPRDAAGNLIRIYPRQVGRGRQYWYVVQPGDTIASICAAFRKPISQSVRLLGLNPGLPRVLSARGGAVVIALQAGEPIRVPWSWVRGRAVKARMMRRRQILANAAAGVPASQNQLFGLLGDGEDDGSGGEGDNPPPDEPNTPDPNSPDPQNPDPGEDPADRYSYLANIPIVQSLIAASQSGQDPTAWASSLSPGQLAAIVGLCGVLSLGLSLVATPVVGAFAAAVCTYAAAHDDPNANPDPNTPTPGPGQQTPPSCPAGQHYDAWLDRCVDDRYNKSDVGGHNHYGPDGELVPCDPPTYWWDETRLVCVAINPLQGHAPSCPDGQVWDEASGTCKPTGAPTVPPKDGPGGTPPTGGGGTTVPPKPGPGSGTTTTPGQTTTPATTKPAPGFFSTTAGKVVAGVAVAGAVVVGVKVAEGRGMMRGR